MVNRCLVNTGLVKNSLLKNIDGFISPFFNPKQIWINRKKPRIYSILAYSSSVFFILFSLWKWKIYGHMPPQRHDTQKWCFTVIQKIPRLSLWSRFVYRSSKQNWLRKVFSEFLILNLEKNPFWTWLKLIYKIQISVLFMVWFITFY